MRYYLYLTLSHNNPASRFCRRRSPPFLARPSKLSADLFEAALGILMLDGYAGYDSPVAGLSFHESGSSSAGGRKSAELEVSRWAECMSATSKKFSRGRRSSFAALSPMSPMLSPPQPPPLPPPLPSKVVADLLRKAAETRSSRGRGSRHQPDALARQIASGLAWQRGSAPFPPGGQDLVQRGHFDTVASALLSALGGRGDGDGNGGATADNARERATADGTETTAAATDLPSASSPTSFSFPTTSSASFSASFAISVPLPSSSSSSSSSSSTTATITNTAATPAAAVFDGGPSSPDQGDPGRRSGRYEDGDCRRLSPTTPTPPRLLFVAGSSVSRLASRAVAAEAESERLSCRLRDAIGLLQDSTFELANGASELERVMARLERVGAELAAVEAEAAADKGRLDEVCPHAVGIFKKNAPGGDPRGYGGSLGTLFDVRIRLGRYYCTTLKNE